jgi:hypothetical protein
VFFVSSSYLRVEINTPASRTVRADRGGRSSSPAGARNDSRGGYFFASLYG